ncbi:MAG: phage tail protein [Proteobacteria bacterium]|nr:phage tail protein [Pseudomonadota bacterium]
MARVTDRHGRPVGARMPGVVEALVVDNRDPGGMGRIKVKFPTLPGMPESTWARLNMPMAGRDRGWMTIPEIDDEVLVSFMHGDIQHAVIVGSLYNGVDTPPYANEDGENNLRVFKSRSGHKVTFDDTDGGESIEIITNNGAIRILMDAANKVVSVYCDGDVLLECTEHFDVKAETFALSAEKDVSITAGDGIVVNAGSVAGVLGGSQVQINAPDVLIN